MNLSHLKFPNKSHRKVVSFPGESEDLAEFLGIVAGDGGINNPWQIVISLNALSDLLYSSYVAGLIVKLFDLRPAIRVRTSCNTLTLIASSTTLIEYLVSKGAVRGNKVLQEIDVPGWVQGDLIYRKRFVRGLVDTDGCLFIQTKASRAIGRGNLHYLGLCFTSLSRRLISSVADVLKAEGIEPHISDGGRRIYLYSCEAVVEYLRIFGSSNPRILSKYQEWRGVRVA